MGKRLRFTLLVAVLGGTLSLGFYVIQSSFKIEAKANAKAQSRQAAQDKEAKVKERHEKFAKGRDLLLRHGVPFDPEILLQDNWQKILKETFDKMPELQQDWQAGEFIEGVIIARDLYLPEKVTIIGETIILVRRIIYEGTNPEIKGKGASFHIFPIESSGLKRVKISQLAVPKFQKISNSFVSNELTNNGLTDLQYVKASLSTLANFKFLYTSRGYLYFQGGTINMG